MVNFFFNLFLFACLTFVFISNHWLIIWVWLECVTLSLVVLLQPNLVSCRGLESVCKYFVAQSVAGVVILFGVLLRFYSENTFFVEGCYGLSCHFVILIGLLVKLAVLPSPFWFVDAVGGVPFSRSFYLIVLSKLSPLYLLFSIVDSNLILLLAAVGLISALTSAVLGINQSSFRKLLAYSSISNLGWFVVCMPFLSGGLVIFCLLSYICMVVPVLWIGSCFSFNFLVKSTNLYNTPTNKLIILVSLLSLGGLPPSVGFFFKWVFFQSLVEGGLYWVSILLVITSLFSLFFYLIVSFNLYSLVSPNSKGSTLFFYNINSIENSFWTILGSLLSINLVFFMGLFWGIFI
uniref:NADH-ubiquinone oxidoreductase chain 2 n=1 Tax=Ophiopholis mirabilis TaxID=2705304 RepID=A0A6C0FFU7_9ECHI|nr:NADH dehydrogenase subunit 2 [Ophiopholis mirabilis]QHT54271.1 NADH dehydrogenase subunit 2 [Ophiopholis mirabilis]